MFKEFFESRTFCDHMGEPSFGRRAMFFILLFLGFLSIFALGMVTMFPKQGKQISDTTLGIIGWGVALISLFYGAMQGSKGMAQLGIGSPSSPIVPPIPVVPMSPVSLAAQTPLFVQPPSGAPPMSAIPPQPQPQTQPLMPSAKAEEPRG